MILLHISPDVRHFSAQHRNKLRGVPALSRQLTMQIEQFKNLHTKFVRHYVKYSQRFRGISCIRVDCGSPQPTVVRFVPGNRAVTWSRLMFNSSVSTCTCDQGSDKGCMCLSLRNVFVLLGPRSLAEEPGGGVGEAELRQPFL